MKIAFLIDKESVFSTPNFIRLLNDVAKNECLSIDFIVSIRKCKFYDFVFALTDKFVDDSHTKLYNVYPLYLDENINEFLSNDLFYSNEYYDDYEYEELFYYEKAIISKIIKEFKEKNREYLYICEILKRFEEDKNDFVTIEGNVPVIISAPHNVSQYYNGTYKPCDYDTGKIALGAIEKLKCYGIIKTKNIGSIFKNDNANRQLNCPYRTMIKQIVRENNIKVVIDIHSLNKKCKEQINFGINDGKNLFNKDNYITDLINIAKDNGFKVSIDSPFKGGFPTISDYASQKLGIYSLQIGINSKYINHIYKTSKYNNLVNMIKEIGDYFNSMGK